MTGQVPMLTDSPEAEIGGSWSVGVGPVDNPATLGVREPPSATSTRRDDLWIWCPSGVFCLVTTLSVSCGPSDSHLRSPSPSRMATPSAALAPLRDQTLTPSPSTTPTPQRTTRPREPSSPPAKRGSFESAFTIETLSRGKGVPQEADDALARLKAYVEADRARSVAARVSSIRIGLEGETRTCVEYRTRDAGAKALEYAQSLFTSLELVNLKLERCGPEFTAK